MLFLGGGMGDKPYDLSGKLALTTCRKLSKSNSAWAKDFRAQGPDFFYKTHIFNWKLSFLDQRAETDGIFNNENGVILSAYNLRDDSRRGIVPVYERLNEVQEMDDFRRRLGVKGKDREILESIDHALIDDEDDRCIQLTARFVYHSNSLGRTQSQVRVSNAIYRGMILPFALAITEARQ